MIVAFLESPWARAAVREAALAEEDVFFGERAGFDALHRGFPRMIVTDCEEGERPTLERFSVPIVHLTEARDSGRAAREDARGRLRMALRTARQGTWVDRVLASLARSAGGPLPAGFRGLARRVLEYPAGYTDLHEVAALGGLTRGALKARFRRRGLRSPYEHLRWLRAIAASHVLADPAVTVAEASYALGYTSGGNLCRGLHSATGLTPGDLRSPGERTALLVRFAERFLTPAMRDGWDDLDDVFLTGSSAA